MVSHSATSTYILGAVLLLPLLPLYIKQILSFLPAQWELGRLTYFVSKPSELELDWFTSMAKEYDLACPDQLFRPYIFTFDPLIIYLENYISHRETRYLVELAEGIYEPSSVEEPDEDSEDLIKGSYDPELRTSTTAYLPEDPVVTCIERRSLDFQGFLPTSQIENLQATKYEVNDRFRPHYDWLQGPEPNPRLSTIFAYLHSDNLMGGSTQFPRLRQTIEGSWCKFLECGHEKESEGASFKPLVGNAVLFTHYHANGTGHRGSWHAGMPVKRGTKIGMNIMTRQFPGFSGDF